MTSELGSTSIRMLGSLLLVLGLIMLLYYLAKRVRLRSDSRLSHIPQMRLLGTLNIAPKRALALVEFSDQWLILGVGAESVRLISSMERPPAAEQAHDQDRQKGKNFQDFFPVSGLLHPWRSDRAPRKDASTP